MLVEDAWNGAEGFVLVSLLFIPTEGDNTHLVYHQVHSGKTAGHRPTSPIVSSVLMF